MGLGKTIQVIALLARLGEKNVKGPFLIIAPLATLPNWMNELKKWLPSVPCALYHGAKDGRRDVWAKQFRACASKGTVVTPIMVTSYEIAILDRSILEKITWKYMIVDEGQVRAAAAAAAHTYMIYIHIYTYIHIYICHVRA